MGPRTPSPLQSSYSRNDEIDDDDYDGDDDDDDDDDSGREAVGVSHAAPPRFRPLDNGRMGGVHSTGCVGFIGFTMHKSV